MLKRSASPARKSFLGPALRRLMLATLVIAPVLALVLAVETAPRVSGAGAPDGVAAEQARAVAERLRALMDGGDVAAGLTVSESELNGALASAGRLVPGLLGATQIDREAVAVDLSLGAPLLPSGIWANLRLAFGDTGDGVEVVEARIGRLPLPPALAGAGLRLGLDRWAGAGAADAAFGSVAGLSLRPGIARIDLRVGPDGRVAALELIRAQARGAAGSDARELAHVQLREIDAAVRDGRLPRSGSVLPYLRFVVENAAGQQGPDRERARGALYALALYCGDPRFETAVGVSMHPRMQGGRNGCEATTLGGREDLRRHFVIAAGLEAAASGTAAFGMGELKELVDSNAGGTGFSFDDMAAGAAGIGFARTFLGTPRDGWAGLSGRIGSEPDVVPPLGDLPGGLSSEEFRDSFGAVDSDAYAALVTEITRRVDALPVHEQPLAH